MIKGVVRSSPGLLKLVHPGGFVEVHGKPVAAVEVMMKNPRHWVTRPDVFRFPWIVVRPESILEPGNVFFIVPFHTIHRLLRDHHIQSSPSKPIRPSPCKEILRKRFTYFGLLSTENGNHEGGGDDEREGKEGVIHQNGLHSNVGNSFVLKPCQRSRDDEQEGEETVIPQTGLESNLGNSFVLKPCQRSRDDEQEGEETVIPQTGLESNLGNSFLLKPCLRSTRSGGTPIGLRNRRVTFREDVRNSRRRLTAGY